MEKELQEQPNILDILLDEDNEDPITLYDENEKECHFEQIAIIPKNEKLYAILKPVEEMEGVGDDEAICFEVKADKDDEVSLVIEPDEKVAESVFEDYYKLLDEQK